MKSLVIYDSAFGNTKQIAQAIARGLESEIILVGDCKAENLDGLDLLIVGSPINGWRPLPSITNFLNSLAKDKLKGLAVSTFDTRVKLFIHGDAKNQIAKHLASLGAKVITPPEAFYVKGKEGPLFEGELDRALEWGKSIKNKK